ncbi:hypothetical protein BCU63_24945 [Vibrio splendidus]|nr:hypothetical protein BCU63_24945 [Vibrio splendidus]
MYIEKKFRGSFSIFRRRPTFSQEQPTGWGKAAALFLLALQNEYQTCELRNYMYSKPRAVFHVPRLRAVDFYKMGYLAFLQLRKNNPYQHGLFF